MLPIGIVYLMGVYAGNGVLRIGEVRWYERPVVWFWPVTLPLFLLGWVFKEVFWA